MRFSHNLMASHKQPGIFDRFAFESKSIIVLAHFYMKTWLVLIKNYNNREE